MFNIYPTKTSERDIYICRKNIGLQERSPVVRAAATCTSVIKENFKRIFNKGFGTLWSKECLSRLQNRWKMHQARQIIISWSWTLQYMVCCPQGVILVKLLYRILKLQRHLTLIVYFLVIKNISLPNNF